MRQPTPGLASSAHDSTHLPADSRSLRCVRLARRLWQVARLRDCIPCIATHYASTLLLPHLCCVRRPPLRSGLLQCRVALRRCILRAPGHCRRRPPQSQPQPPHRRRQQRTRSDRQRRSNMQAARSAVRAISAMQVALCRPPPPLLRRSLLSRPLRRLLPRQSPFGL